MVSDSDPFLIVEDNPDCAVITSFLAEQMGYRVIHAETASATRHLVANFRFSLIVLDVDLPDGDGIELCKWIRSLDPCTPILIHSATDLTRRDLLSAGADAFVPKCHGIAPLEDAFRSALRTELPGKTCPVEAEAAGAPAGSSQRQPITVP